MEIPYQLTTLLSSFLDRAFAHNEEARAALEPYRGRLVAIELTAPDIQFHVLVLEESLEVLSAVEDAADATVQTDVAGLLALSRGSDALLAGKARVRGDLRLVEGLHRAVTLLAIDWEDQLAPLVGDAFAHKLSSLVDRLWQDSARNRDRAREDVQRYLQHETGLLVTRSDWRQLTDETDTLRSDIDRLAARLSRLESDE